MFRIEILNKKKDLSNIILKTEENEAKESSFFENNLNTKYSLSPANKFKSNWEIDSRRLSNSNSIKTNTNNNSNINISNSNNNNSKIERNSVNKIKMVKGEKK